MLVVPWDELGQRIAANYESCLLRARMEDGQVARNLMAFVSTRPQLQAGSVQSALMQYLHELCG
jgi:hypothetical protein